MFTDDLILTFSASYFTIVTHAYCERGHIILPKLYWPALSECLIH